MPQEAENSPVYWFAILDMARERKDRELERRATEALRSLGVKVSFEPRAESQHEACHA